MITLKRATTEAVKYACLNFHYAKRVPASRYAYNVYSDGEWCGVVIYGPGASPYLATSNGFETGEILELVRVALNGKQKFTSEVVAKTLRQVHKDAPQVKVIVSYADTDQGHVGTIYQATNWLYIGMGSPIHCFVINGKKVHFRSISSKYGFVNLEWIRKHVDPNAGDFTPGGKHKYVYFFDKRLRREWMGKALPYPKKQNTG